MELQNRVVDSHVERIWMLELSSRYETDFIMDPDLQLEYWPVAIRNGELKPSLWFAHPSIRWRPVAGDNVGRDKIVARA